MMSSITNAYVNQHHSSKACQSQTNMYSLSPTISNPIEFGSSRISDLPNQHKSSEVHDVDSVFSHASLDYKSPPFLFLSSPKAINSKNSNNYFDNVTKAQEGYFGNPTDTKMLTLQYADLLEYTKQVELCLEAKEHELQRIKEYSRHHPLFPPSPTYLAQLQELSLELTRTQDHYQQALNVAHDANRRAMNIQRRFMCDRIAWEREHQKLNECVRELSGALQRSEILNNEDIPLKSFESSLVSDEKLVQSRSLSLLSSAMDPQSMWYRDVVSSTCELKDCIKYRNALINLHNVFITSFPSEPKILNSPEIAIKLYNSIDNILKSVDLDFSSFSMPFCFQGLTGSSLSPSMSCSHSTGRDTIPTILEPIIPEKAKTYEVAKKLTEPSSSPLSHSRLPFAPPVPNPPLRASSEGVVDSRSISPSTPSVFHLPLSFLERPRKLWETHFPVLSHELFDEKKSALALFQNQPTELPEQEKMVLKPPPPLIISDRPKQTIPLSFRTPRAPLGTKLNIPSGAKTSRLAYPSSDIVNISSSYHRTMFSMESNSMKKTTVHRRSTSAFTKKNSSTVSSTPRSNFSKVRKPLVSSSEPVSSNGNRNQIKVKRFTTSSPHLIQSSIRLS